MVTEATTSRSEKTAAQSSLRRSFAPPQKRQRGISLFVILVFVMLSMLLAIWASRASFFNELLVGSDADYRRAFEAAQALLQDAELDIQGVNSDGTACTPDSNAPAVCRRTTAERIPTDDQELSMLLANLAAAGNQKPKCRNGLCIKRADRTGDTDKQDFWNNQDEKVGITLKQMTSVGARFGQFTGARPGDNSNPANPLLRETAEGKGGWYWIEVLPYASVSGSGLVVGGAGHLAINQKPNVVYRITALSFGRKPHTQVVLQQTLAQQKFKN